MTRVHVGGSALAACVLAALLFVLQATGAETQARKAEYKGWNTLALENGLIEVQVAPDIGGRVIQFKLGSFEFLWVNDWLAGKAPPPNGVGPKGEWLNYGGDKLWPAPQGWDSDEQWPGPPDPILDGSPHAGVIAKAGGQEASVQLTSQPDTRSGISFMRTIAIRPVSTRVGFETTMTNTSAKLRRWGIWQVTQHNAASRGGTSGRAEKELWAYCPFNPKSVFRRGYEEMFGLVNDPTFKPDYARGLMRVHYERRVGKIGMDCSAGWLAVVNGTAGYAFVHRFTYYPEKKYPDQASVEFWSNGAGEFVAGGKLNVCKDDPVETPYLIESEVLSPRAELEPGERYTFRSDWYAAKIGGNFPALDCTDAGIMCEPFAAKTAQGTLTVSGRFGVFYVGTAELVFFDAKDNEIRKAGLLRAATPLEPFVLAGATVPAPEGVRKVVLMLYTPDGRGVGKLASAELK